MPNALLEAMCLGLPCLSTKVSGASEFIKDGYNGGLVEIGNVEQLSDMISYVIDNEDFASMISENATSVYQQVNFNEVTRKWASFLT